MKIFARLILSTLLAFFTVSIFAASPTPPAKPMVVVTPEEKAKIEQVVKQYLIEKPEIIIEAVQNYQKKQYEQTEQTIKNTQKNIGKFAQPLFHKEGDPVAGNPNGIVTVVEFFDYQCPHCVDMAPVIEAIIKKNSDVRVVFKDFPIRGPQSELGARAALAAHKQGKYYEFSHALLTSKQPLSQGSINQVAKSKGVDLKQLQQDMNDPSIQTRIKENTQLAQDLKLFGTPAFFIGQTKGTEINYTPGRLDETQMQKIIDQSKNQVH